MHCWLAQDTPFSRSARFTPAWGEVAADVAGAVVADVVVVDVAEEPLAGAPLDCRVAAEPQAVAMPRKASRAITRLAVMRCLIGASFHMDLVSHRRVPQRAGWASRPLVGRAQAGNGVMAKMTSVGTSKYEAQGAGSGCNRRARGNPPSGSARRTPRRASVTSLNWLGDVAPDAGFNPLRRA